MRIDGASLFRHEGFRFALFRRQGGHAPELEDKETRLWLGRFIGRIHAVGRARRFKHRPALTPERFGAESIATIIEGRWLPPHMETAFESLAEDLMTSIENAYARAGDFRMIRLHGDCHPGNLLWRDGPFFVDMDDCQSGPAVQDLWMLLSGDRYEMEAQLADVIEGYRQFCDFNTAELQLIEALRTLQDAAPRRLAGAALGGSGVSDRVSVVRQPAVLGGPGTGAEGAVGGDAGGGAGAFLASRYPPSPSGPFTQPRPEFAIGGVHRTQQPCVPADQQLQDLGGITRRRHEPQPPRVIQVSKLERTEG